MSVLLGINSLDFTWSNSLDFTWHSPLPGGVDEVLQLGDGRLGFDTSGAHANWKVLELLWTSQCSALSTLSTLRNPIPRIQLSLRYGLLRPWHQRFCLPHRGGRGAQIETGTLWGSDGKSVCTVGWSSIAFWASLTILFFPCSFAWSPGLLQPPPVRWAASQAGLAGREYTAHWEGGKVSVKAWRPRSLSKMSTPCCMETVGGTMTANLQKSRKISENQQLPGYWVAKSSKWATGTLLDLSRGGSLPCPSIAWVSLQEYDRALIQAHCFEDGWDLSWWATTREFSVKLFCWKQAVLGSRPTKLTSNHQLFSVLLDNP